MAAAAPPDSAAAAAAPAIVDCFPFAALPPPLLLKFFAALPADARLRCVEVCRDWRATLAERSLWTRLDVSAESGVTTAVTPALLRAAAAKAGGALAALDVSGAWRLLGADEALREVLAANAGALRELRLRGREPYFLSPLSLWPLLAAAPQLRVCEADLDLVSFAAGLALRNEGVFAPLRVRACALACRHPELGAATQMALLADVAAHDALAELHVRALPFDEPEALDAFVGAALSLPRLRSVALAQCGLTPASAPALARLLRGAPSLAELRISQDPSAPLYGAALLDGASAALLGAALRENKTLTSLELRGTGLWSDRGAASALLGALTGHGSLRTLRITRDAPLAAVTQECNHWHAGALLGALVAADAPALTALDVSGCVLFEHGLRPLFEALPRNAHLRQLDCSDNAPSDAFAADVLLPAVRAHASLRTLRLAGCSQSDAARTAEALVARRRGQA
jgi:hypothetical protein